MIIYTDDTACAEGFLTPDEPWRSGMEDFLEPGMIPLIGELFSGGDIRRSRAAAPERWRYAFVVKNAPRSQYDLLIELNQKGMELPDGILCLAGSGREFHGQRGRPWSALEGNIHLSLFLGPQRPIERFHIGFSILAAVALVAAIDRFEALRGAAGIKWVNDVLIDGAKVAGFLAQTSSLERRVAAAVLGIGLNVETAPVLSGDRFVPRAAALRDFLPDTELCNRRRALHYLLDSLASGYEELLDGGYDVLLDRYRERSLVIGRSVRIFADSLAGSAAEIAAGRVLEIGDNLELYLDSTPEPVTRGRLILGSEHA